MKTTIKILSILLLSVSMLFVGCEDRTDLTPPKAPDTGNANFTSFVTLGNSLTAGYQNGALYQSAQAYSFGNQIAQLVGAKFEQPLVSDPGIGSDGRMEIKSLTATGVEITYNKNSGSPLNLNYAAPYNNLGVPGAILAEMVKTKDKATSLTGNAFFDLILRGLGTPVEQALALKPTLMTVWIGNNDILGYAAKGGTVGYTDPVVFAYLYNSMLDTLAMSNAKVFVANIPDVSSVPYFTTVGPMVAAAIAPAVKAGLAFGLFYQKNGQKGPADPTSLADTTALATGKVLLTLAGAKYASLIGQPTGAFYRDYLPGVDPAILGVDTTKAFGLDPKNPYPDAFILDPDEINTVNTTIASYNGVIANSVAQHNFTLVDINAFFNGVAKNGYQANGLTFTAAYVTGGLFGLDGVHPTNQGYGIIANQFIKAINSNLNASIPMIDVSRIPGSLILAKKIKFNKMGLPIIDPHAFDHLVF